ncbi:FAD-dependent oxidoreductase [Streptomyces gamaensis]|uniref:FAD-dependent oxidoreductase n=1 Tax=Streptomyces gamaensis TaxID=1763542 RepID=A0ABW0Z7Z1_9ACTN
MRATDPDGPEVLVVGAGPTGLLAACELLRRGVRVRVVDQSDAPAAEPRALSLWPRAVDILTDLGVGDELRAASVPVNGYSYFSAGRPVARFAFPADCAARNLPQYVTERLLTGRLHAFGGKIERGVRLFAAREESGAVTARLDHGDGVVETVRTPWLLGADGAGSTVRHLIGSRFEGATYPMAFALLDTRVEGPLPPDEIRYYQAPDGTLIVVPLPDGVFRVLCVAPGDGRGIDVTGMQRLLETRGPRGVRITEPQWQTVFKVHARRATTLRRGRILLLGDAAHVHSPAGGQGMNNGLQDAHNLAWKLAAVLHGTSPAGLLDGYGRERAEATARIVRDTDLQTRAWMAGHPARVAVRDAAFRLLERTGAVTRWYAPVMAGRRLAHAPVRATQSPSGPAGCRLRGRLPGGLPPGAVLPRPLALSYGIAGPQADPDSWVLALLAPEAGRERWLADAGRIAARRQALRVVRLCRADAAPVTGCRSAGYYLVRPDGHIAAHGHQGDLGRLDSELGHVLNSRLP